MMVSVMHLVSDDYGKKCLKHSFQTESYSEISEFSQCVILLIKNKKKSLALASPNLTAAVCGYGVSILKKIDEPLDMI